MPGTICGGIPVMEVRTKPSVKDGIATDFSVNGIRHILYQPGNGTRYSMLLFSLDGLKVAGREDSLGVYQIVLLDHGKGGGNSSISFNAKLGRNVPHPSYVREKLGKSMADCLALVELFEYLGEGKNELYGIDNWLAMEPQREGA